MKALRTVRVAQPTVPVLWFAAVVAVAMMSMYVQLLHDSVARGERLRSEQRVVDVSKANKSGAPPARAYAR